MTSRKKVEKKTSEKNRRDDEKTMAASVAREY